MCQERNWPHLYIGFMNKHSAKLRYKEQFNSLELLLPGRGWVRLEDTDWSSIGFDVET